VDGRRSGATLGPAQALENRLGLRGSLQRLVECFGWFQPAEGLSRSSVELGGDGVEVGLGERGEAGALGEVLAQQTVDASMSSNGPVLCDVVLPGGSVLDHRAVDDVDQVAFEYAPSAAGALGGRVAGQ
jgi:hypothetical protein